MAILSGDVRNASIVCETDVQVRKYAYENHIQK